MTSLPPPSGDMEIVNGGHEKWRNVVGYESLYEVSNFGNVRRKKTGKILSRRKLNHGYSVASLCKDGKVKNHKYSRLVASAFIANPNKLPCVNHKDGNKINDSVGNLEWCTYSENNKHAYNLGLKKPICGVKVWKAKLNESDIRKIKVLLSMNVKKVEIARIFKVSHTCICNIAMGRTWKHVSEHLKTNDAIETFYAHMVRLDTPKRGELHLLLISLFS